MYDELQKIVEKSELPEMSRFTNLRDRILEVVCGVLKRCLAPTNQMIHNIIQVSKSCTRAWLGRLIPYDRWWKADAQRVGVRCRLS